MSIPSRSTSSFPVAAGRGRVVMTSGGVSVVERGMDEGLTDQQKALCAAVAKGERPDRAARDAGVSDKLLRDWKKWPPFRQALDAAAGQAFAKAVNAIKSRRKPGQP